jgi:hypothetical protein
MPFILEQHKDMIINGGFLTMGTKRVGLARMEALMENLKRDLLMSDTTISGANVQLGINTLVEANGATKLLTAAESGATVHLHRAAGSTVTLPADATVGMRYIFVVKTLLSSNGYVINTGTNNTFTTSSFIVQQDATDSNHHAIVFPNDAADVTVTMTFDGTNKTAQFGTHFEVECVAAGKWRITGNHHKDASGSIVFA